MKIFACFLFALTLLSTTQAADFSSGVWMGSLNQDIRVDVDSKSKGVSVTVQENLSGRSQKDLDPIPKSIGITFFDSKGKPVQLELKASDPLENPLYRSARFSGALTPNLPSFTAFELRIPFRAKRPTVIRSVDLKRIPPIGE
jgi:hypothetical protein